jgi:hypothetical protein
MMPRKPDQGEALKQLRNNLLLLGSWCLVIRAAPYVMQHFTVS